MVYRGYDSWSSRLKARLRIPSIWWQTYVKRDHVTGWTELREEKKLPLSTSRTIFYGFPDICLLVTKKIGTETDRKGVGLKKKTYFENEGVEVGNRDLKSQAGKIGS